MSSNPKTQKKKPMSESDFPTEILFDILSGLPPKDLIRFLCVSKSWYAIIHDHRFIKAHLQRSIQTNSAPTILFKSYVSVAPPSNFFSLPFNDDEAFGFLNRALSWLMQNELDKNRCIILTLDLPSEKCLEFDTPVDEDDKSVLNTEVLAGCLCISVNVWCRRHDIWIMKEYGVTESWTLLYSIERKTVRWLLGYCTPLVFSKNGEMVLLKMGHDNALVWFDLEEKSGNQVKIGDLPLSFEATICIGSLSLLDGDPMIVGRQRSRVKSPSTTELVCPLDEVFPATISCLSYASGCLANIRGRFKKDILKKFENLCFSHLVDVDHIDWFGQLTHYTILRAIKDRVSDDSIFFLFGEHVATFGSHKFCLVTGLSFGEFPPKRRKMNVVLETSMSGGKRR